MNEVISKTRPLSDGSMLWCVHHKGLYHDSDPRGASDVPIDERNFVLAKSRDEAIQKASSLPSVKQAAKLSEKKLVAEAAIVTIETLVPARDSSEDGRMGWTSTDDLLPVGLEHPDDSAWKLAVCLVPSS